LYWVELFAPRSASTIRNPGNLSGSAVTAARSRSALRLRFPRAASTAVGMLKSRSSLRRWKPPWIFDRQVPPLKVSPASLAARYSSTTLQK